MACAGIWVTALLVRLGHLWLLQDSPLSHVLMGDARRYHEWGAEIARGHWLGTESFYQAPLYPYFIGCLYRVFGPEQTLVRIAQAILGATSCVCLACAGRRFFSPKTGLLAGALFAVYGPAVFFDGIIQKTSLGSFLTCALLAAMARAAYRPGRVWVWGLLGVLLGALMLTRENALVLAALLPVWLAFGWGRASFRARAGWLACAGLGMIVVLFPVALRNRVVGGEWLLTTSQFGPNFYIGNSQFANGRYLPLLQDRGGPEYERIDAVALAEQDRGRPLTPGEVSAYWMEMALADIRADWPGWFRLMARKWFLIGNATEIIDTEDIYTHAESSWLLAGLLKIWHWGVLAPLACLGLVLAWKSWRRHGVLALFVLAYATSVSLFYVFGRYRFPLVPPLTLLAAAGLMRLPGCFRQRHIRGLALGLVGAGLFAFLCNLPGEPLDPMQSNTHYMLAVNLEADGADAGLIEREYDLAEHFNPRYAEVFRMRGNFERNRGNTKAALDYYERCVNLDGDFLLGRYDYGLALYDLKRYSECWEQLEVVHRSEPSFDEGWLQCRMGAAAFQLRRFPEAAQHFQAARKWGRNEALLDRNLARCWMAQGQFGRAALAFRHFLAAEPDDWRAEIMLGDCHQQLGQIPAALMHWRRALDRLPAEAPESLSLRNKIRREAQSRPLPARREPGNPRPALGPVPSP